MNSDETPDAALGAPSHQSELNKSILSDAIDLLLKLFFWLIVVPIIVITLLIGIYAVPLLGVLLALGLIIMWRRKAAASRRIENAEAVRVAVRDALAERDVAAANEDA